MKIRISPLAGDLIWILFLTLFAGFIVTDEFVSRNGTFWDNAFFYSIFWNQLDSMNRFGEPAWWFPGNQYGWPAFYYSMLGDVPCSTPVFAALAVFAWICGLFGFELNYYFLYTVYYGYLVPGLATLAAYYVLRLFFKSRVAIWFGLTLTAFSPGVVVNTSDIGFLEPIVYSLFFFGCWVRFLRQPDATRFWLLTLAVCAVGLSINYPFLMWNVHFLPASVLLTIFAVPGGVDRLVRALKSAPAPRWAAALAMIVVCALPSFAAFSYGKDFIRNTLKATTYHYRDLKAGNPLEIFGSGIPSFGFEWKDGLWTLKAAAYDTHIAFQYLGILCLPLAICALLYGPTWFRRNMLLMVVLVSSVIALSAHNPLMSLAIRMSKALQTNDHWSDLGFRTGAFLVFIFLGAAGFELLANGQRRAVRTLPFVAALFFLLAVTAFFSYHGQAALGSTTFGLLCVLTVLMLIAAGWLWSVVNEKRRKIALWTLLILTVVDVSTLTALHMRAMVTNFKTKVIPRVERIDEETTGLRRMATPGIGDMAEHILKLEPHFEMVEAKLYPWNLWQYGLFAGARVLEEGPLRENIAKEKARLEQNPDSYVLPLDREFKDHPDFQPFFVSSAAPLSGDIAVESITYNELILNVKTSAPAVLFIRDAFYKGWSAEVNGKPATIARALFNSKALALSAGESKIHLEFFPQKVAYTLLAAYLVFIGLSVYNVRLLTRRKNAKRTR